MSDWIQHTEKWVRGEILQGKIMLTVGGILFIACYFIWRNGNEVFLGMLIPLGLILLILFGYGGFQTFSRPFHINKVKKSTLGNEKKALSFEINKAEKDHKNYTLLKKVWGTLIIASVFFYLFVNKPYLKGVALGLIVLFLTTLIVDSVLHKRLKIYHIELLSFE